MGIGKIDPEYAIREGWARDSDDEIYMDGYNAFIQVTTRDGTSGFSVKNDIGAVTFSTKSDGDGYVAKRLGIGTYNPIAELEVIGKIKTDQFQMITGAYDGYILTCDSEGNATWEDAYVGGASSGLNEDEHRNLDQLVHLVSEDSFEEIVYSANRVVSVIVWTDSGKTTKVREEQFSYDSENRVTQILTIQYNYSGNEVERMVEDFAYSGGRVISVTRDVILQ